jgi:hypothetical protein
VNPPVTFAGWSVLWLVFVSPDGGRTYRRFAEPRTERFITRALAGARRNGQAAHLELETTACGPVVFDLAELVAIGIVHGESEDEHAVVVAREALTAERKGPKRVPRFLEGIGERASAFRAKGGR